MGYRTSLIRALLAWASGGWVGVGHAADALLLSYIEKPPYYHTESGVPRGFLMERAQRVLAEAGVAVKAESRPAKRILAELEADSLPQCSVGWFRSPAREAFARFSLPIHRDAPFVVASRAELAERVGKAGSFKALVADPALRAAAVEGYSYGAYVDPLLAGNERVLRVVGTPAQVLRMLAAGRGDYALIDARELPPLAAEAGLNPRRFALTSLPDLPAGNLRHLMCSRSVSPATLARIDDAIRRLGLQP